jgi:hypothetical protein
MLAWGSRILPKTHDFSITSPTVKCGLNVLIWVLWGKKGDNGVQMHRCGGSMERMGDVGKVWIEYGICGEIFYPFQTSHALPYWREEYSQMALLFEAKRPRNSNQQFILPWKETSQGIQHMQL